MKEIVLDQERQPQSLAPSPEVAAKAAFWLGLVLAIPGWLDVGMLYLGAQWASIEWEFGTVSNTFDALPLGSLGLVLASLGALASGRKRGLKVLAVLFGLLSLGLIAVALIFALDMPVMWRAVRPEMATAYKYSILKTAVSVMVYVPLYVGMTVFCWKRSRPST